jgi:septation ring formation regulator EzrA
MGKDTQEIPIILGRLLESAEQQSKQIDKLGEEFSLVRIRVEDVSMAITKINNDIDNIEAEAKRLRVKVNKSASNNRKRTLTEKERTTRFKIFMERFGPAILAIATSAGMWVKSLLEG